MDIHVSIRESRHSIARAIGAMGGMLRTYPGQFPGNSEALITKYRDELLKVNATLDEMDMELSPAREEAEDKRLAAQGWKDADASEFVSGEEFALSVVRGVFQDSYSRSDPAYRHVEAFLELVEREFMSLKTVDK